MINKRLLGIFPDSLKFIKGNVLYQWLGLIANIFLIFSIGSLLERLYAQSYDTGIILRTGAIAILAIIIRFVCTIKAGKMSYLASKSVKKLLRSRIYEKLLRLGSSYSEKVSTSEVVQVSVEGIEQLETYFGSYLPQLFYSLLAPITLFAVLSFISFKSAVVLLICVPLIPVSIVAVQKFAKKLLSKYWGQYTALGDSFLENLQGLTTLKIYRADEYKNAEMNNESEHFRHITMKVLTMQLNSISIMNLIAYGGAALGVIMAISQFRAGHIGLMGGFSIIMLSADFFVPLRLLGSYFHIAMNGQAASEKIFKLLDLETQDEKTGKISADNYSVSISDLKFSYDGSREILKDISMEFPQGGFTSVVGKSGCGKSTVAGILSGMNRSYEGSVIIGDTELSEISEASIKKHITLISHNSYLFKGTVRDNLLMGDSDATEEMMWAALESVRLSDYIRGEKGLDTPVLEKASNLSGGQCQRLALARAILHNSSIYIFDEATSNIDVESENVIMELISKLAKRATVILISHRLANVADSNNIYVMESGEIKEAGNHNQLLEQGGIYKELWDTQQNLENYTGEAAI